MTSAVLHLDGTEFELSRDSDLRELVGLLESAEGSVVLSLIDGRQVEVDLRLDAEWILVEA